VEREDGVAGDVVSVDLHVGRHPGLYRVVDAVSVAADVRQQPPRQVDWRAVRRQLESVRQRATSRVVATYRQRATDNQGSDLQNILRFVVRLS